MLCGYETTCMSNECSEKRCATCQAACRNGMMILVGIIAGLVFAAAAVLLLRGGFLTNLFPVVLAVLVTGLTTLLAVPTAAFALRDGSDKKQCIRCHFGGLFFGIIGTVIAAVLTLAADLTAVSIFVTVMWGITAFFFAYLIVSILFVTLCAAES